MRRERIAIVGTGISGLAVAHRLYADHDLTLFEASGHVGGHTRTINVPEGDRQLAIDTGFVVYNEATYPHLVKLFEELGVGTKPTSMSFSVRDEASGIEYCGSSLNAVFAQRRNLFRPSFLRMAREIVHFNKVAKQRLAEDAPLDTLGGFLASEGFSQELTDRYVIPMGAAIWSTSLEGMLDFPARFFLGFLENHGLLSVESEHLQWRVVEGGSKRYVERMIAPFRSKIRLREPVLAVSRSENQVEVATATQRETFDRVVLAVHADQALRVLTQPSALEQKILRCFPYQVNRAVVHRDQRLMPAKRRAWASWNYLVPKHSAAATTLTYDMTHLQGLDAAAPVFVTLNLAEHVDEKLILDETTFEHPAFSLASLAAQARFDQIDGRDRVHFCGAYWRNGFHEDGYVSGLRVADRIEATLAAPTADRDQLANPAAARTANPGASPAASPATSPAASRAEVRPA